MKRSQEVDAAAQRAFVVSLLEERFGHAAPSSISNPTGDSARRPEDGPSRDRRWHLLAAAVLLLGVGTVATVWRARSVAPPGDALPVVAPKPQDGRGKSPKPNRPDVTTSSWEPRTVEELRAALANLQRVRVRYHRIEGMKVKATDFPPGPLVTILGESAQRKSFQAGLLRVLKNDPVPMQRSGDLELRLDLPKYKHVATSIMPSPRGRGRVLVVDGLGAFPIESKLVDAIAKSTFLASAEQSTMAALGLAHPERLRDLPPGAAHLRLHSFELDDLDQLVRFRQATSVDLRLAPEIHAPAALRKLREVLPGLKTLRMRGDGLVDAAWRQIVGFANLRELQILSESGSYWGVPKSRDAVRVDDGAARYLVQLEKLRSLIIPGSSLTDAGLRQLASLHELRRLIISGSPALTSAGFVAFGPESALAEVHANGCRKLDDRGLQALAELPALRQLFLRESRVLHPATLADMASNVSPNGLAALGASKTLTRLELGGWFATIQTHPLRFAKATKDGDGSILARSWRPALAKVAQIPTLEWLALDRSPDLVLADLDVLRGSAVRVLNVAGTVGRSPARIGPESTAHIFGLPRELQTIISDD